MFGPGRYVFAGVGVVFALIGLTVLGFVWGAPQGEFGSPPLFFRVIASFIAVAFVLFGSGFAISALRVGRQVERSFAARQADGAGRSQQATRYACPSCAAPIGEGAEISPSGDVKCPYCDRWFNVERA